MKSSLFPRPSAGAALLIFCVAIIPLPLHSQNAPQNPPANPASRTGAAPPLDNLMNLLDKDKDGRISKEEATGNYAQRFPQWDVNGDGFASRQEIHDYRAKLGIGDEGRSAGNPNPGSQPGGNRAPATAQVLKEPTHWRLETMPMPPGFAPTIQLKGAEEIRFAPGMFNNTAPDYFTCVIAITAEGEKTIGAEDLKDFLQKYYRGLSGGRASRRGTAGGTIEEMVATVQHATGGADSGRFDADMVFFDSFSDGRKVTLHVEADIVARPALKKNFLILLVSPAAKESEVWRNLREIGKNVVKDVSGADAK